ncbi:MAG: acyl-CoA reductase [Flavobacteriia bacterium]|nr:acyl-CoA reductase [Flavobacteriia bacterium]
MKRERIIKGFVQLGKLMISLGNEYEWKGFEVGTTEDEYNKLKEIVSRQFFYNGWFTKENVLQSLIALGGQLEEKKMKQWVSNYQYNENLKRVGIVMAGNIPLVGFHDFLCVLISGNIAVCKLSSDDKTLLPALAAHLIEFCPELKERIIFSIGPISNIDAVIATGSDNSTKYFEQYFGKYPHIFRKNRTSIAIISGHETQEELQALGKDIFAYFGLGCRNVSHLLFPKDFEINRFFEAIVSYSDVINHNKYGNNYDYNKTVYLMNKMQLLDNNFVLLRETEELFSPLAMIHYHYYNNATEIHEYIQKNKDKIQVVVGELNVPFGEAQCPALSDFADGIDVLKWLEVLK